MNKYILYFKAYGVTSYISAYDNKKDAERNLDILREQLYQDHKNCYKSRKKFNEIFFYDIIEINSNKELKYEFDNLRLDGIKY